MLNISKDSKFVLFKYANEESLFIEHLVHPYSQALHFYDDVELS